MLSACLVGTWTAWHGSQTSCRVACSSPLVDALRPVMQATTLPAPPPPTSPSTPAALPTSLPLPQSKLFALLHAGLAFRYPRWQQTAALQSILTVVAVAHTHFHDICTRSELASPAGRWTVDKLSTLLTNCNWLPLAPAAPVMGGRGGGAGGAGQLQVPHGVDRCRLVLAWMQVGSVIQRWGRGWDDEVRRWVLVGAVGGTARSGGPRGAYSPH